MVNTLFAVYSKSGALVAGPEPIKDLWTGFDGPCETENDGDPIVLYDEYAGRWVLSQFALFDTDGDGLDDTSAECVAVSETSDPTGYYYLYAFEMSGLNDYPKLGVGPDSYLYTHNQFSEGFGSYMGAVAGAFEREAMLNGQEAEMVLFGPNPDRSSILPADSDGPIPSGDPPGVFAELKTSTSQIAIYHLDVDWAFPDNATFNEVARLNSFYFDPVVCDDPNFICVPQPNGVKLDALSDRLMFPLHVRNMGSYLAMVTNHTVDAGIEDAGVRWYEFRYDGASWSLHQQGTYAPFGSDHRWMGAIAINADGKIGLVYSVSSESTHPSIRYTGRRPADPPGMMTLAETSIIAGTRSQYGSNRWGDYAALVVDPVDGRTFWAVHEYGSDDDPEPNWDTRIASFQIPDAPPPPPPGSLTASILGPTYRDRGQSGTWTAQVSGGIGAYGYRWDYRINFDFCDPGGGGEPGDPGPEEVQCNAWTHAYYYDGSTTFSRTVNYDAQMDIRLTVTSGSETATAYKYVTIGNGPDGRIGSLAGEGAGEAAQAAEAGATALPEHYALHAVVPNPVSGVGMVRYALPEASEVSLVVYDLLGREVVQLTSGSQAAGLHSVALDPANLPSGVYLVRLQAGSFVATERFAVAR